MNEGRLSIVLLTYNRQQEVCETLARLTSLWSVEGHFPIIVVDNASTDDTTERIQTAFPNVVVLRAPTNLGAAGRNLGVARVRTPYVAFCDDDTAWMPMALSTAAHILDAHPEISVLNARILVGPQARPDAACDAMAASPLRTIEGIGPELTGFMAGACVMRTAAFREAGGYWPPFFIGGEEALLALDILEKGGRIVYAPNLVTRHWPSSLRNAAQRRGLTARNDIWTAWLRYPVRMALRRSAQVMSTVPTKKGKLRLLRDALRGTTLIWRHRQCLSPPVCTRVELVWHVQAVSHDINSVHEP